MHFILSLEPLATLIGDNHSIRGVAAPVTEMKVSLFADDILLTVSDPLNSFINMPAMVNWDKSETIHCHKSHIDGLPFKWSPEVMQYLGMTLKSSLYDIAPVNLNSLINNKVDLERWKSLPLSIWGRIDTLKMNVLPKITFLMSAIPLPLEKSFFKETEVIFRNFTWNNKTPRVSLKNQYVYRCL